MSLLRNRFFATVVAAAGAVVAPSWGYASEPGAPETIGVLTLDAARARALQGHPTLVRLRQQVKGDEARADQIGTALNPTVAGVVDATIGATPPKDFGDPSTTVRAGVVANWLITDFGRVGAHEKAARVAIMAQVTGIKAVEHDILVAVDTAFWSAKASLDLVAVTQASLAAETRHRQEAERFVEAGTRAAIEVARAKTQEARARADVVAAQTQARQALVSLGQAMGLTTTPAGVDGGWSQPLAEESQGPDELFKAAWQVRAEVAAAEERVKAAEASLAAAEKGQLPTLSADAQLGVGAVDFEDWAPSWQVGVTFTWPFYDGGNTSALVAAARADLEAARLVMRELEVEIASEIRSALEAVASGKAEIEAANAVREAAEVELRLAEERWKEGLGSGIELADAQTRLTLAAADRTRAELTLALARARLSRALIGDATR